MSFGTCCVRSLYRSGSLTAGAKELARNKFDFGAVQEVMWNTVGTVIAGDYIFSIQDKPQIIKWEQDIGAPHNSISS